MLEHGAQAEPWARTLLPNLHPHEVGSISPVPIERDVARDRRAHLERIFLWDSEWRRRIALRSDTSCLEPLAGLALTGERKRQGASPRACSMPLLHMRLLESNLDIQQHDRSDGVDAECRALRLVVQRRGYNCISQYVIQRPAQGP